MLRLLPPSHDTTRPFAKANSIYALHPMFLRLEAIGELKDKKRREYYENLRKELNALPRQPSRPSL